MACPTLAHGGFEVTIPGELCQKDSPEWTTDENLAQPLEGSTVESVASASNSQCVLVGNGATQRGKPSWQGTSCRFEAWRCLVDTGERVQQLLNDFWKQQFPGQDTISRAGHLRVLVDCGSWSLKRDALPFLHLLTN